MPAFLTPLQYSILRPCALGLSPRTAHPMVPRWELSTTSTRSSEHLALPRPASGRAARSPVAVVDSVHSGTSKKLSPAEELAWRTRIEGSLGIPERERLGPVTGLQETYRQGLAELGGKFLALDPAAQDDRLREVGDFTRLVYEHVCQGLYGAPEYGGNRGLAGWQYLNYEGDVQPRGFTDAEVSGA